MFFNRDLSWLGFNHRVLQEAKDETVPLYERLRFLSIFSSNLDEFFRVRYPVVAAISKLNKKTIKKESLLTEEDVTEKIQAKINAQLDEFGHILLHDIIPSLKEKKIFFYYNTPLLPEHIAEARQIFLSRVLSFIQPVFLSVESAYDFMPENNHLYFIVTIFNNHKNMVSHVSVNIPSHKLSRFFVLSPINETNYVVFIDDIIRDNLGMLFPGQKIESIFSIKFNRDAEVDLSGEYSVNLLEKIEKQLSKRDVGLPSRFLFERGMPTYLQLFLSTFFKAKMKDMFEGGRYHNLSDLFNFPSFDKLLFYKKQDAIHYPPIAGGDIFANIASKDVLIHLPYQSYIPVLSFFNQAAVDADVKEIYITLYRVATESHIVNALISASKNGKKVTAFIELKARFDEANNIKWSRTMKNAGVKIIYSDPTIKVHSKIALVKKEIAGKISCNAIISTGNFNESTALFYTDHVLMTARPDLCSELEALFNFLQSKKNSSPKKVLPFNELFVTQFNLLDQFELFINNEIIKHKNGLPAKIRIKVNNLEEPYFINLLYKASEEGVPVELMVRSICCLVPEKEKISEHITVKRLVDKHLEHSRLFIFGEGEDAVVAMGSSDLMIRNLRRRIEVCINVKDRNCRQQLIHYFQLQWQDNTKTTRILSNGEQQHLYAGADIHNAQTDIYDYLKKISC
ncbi:MAG: polyphosphate kinase 1 [Ferruginibacter sp.]